MTNYETTLLTFLSIFPGIFICFYIYFRDKHDKEPRGLLIQSFLLGAFSTIPAMFLERIGMDVFGFQISYNLWITFVFAFFVVGLSEELVKFLFLRSRAYNHPAFNEPMDGIVYSVMVSMGFATLENILYIMVRSPDVATSFETAWLRMFTSVPAHASFAVIMGYYIGLAKFNPEKSKLLMFKGVFWAIMFHGAYDFFIFQQESVKLQLVTLVVLLGGIFLSFDLIKKHLKNSPFKKNKHAETIKAFSREGDRKGSVIDEDNSGFKDVK